MLWSQISLDPSLKSVVVLDAHEDESGKRDAGSVCGGRAQECWEDIGKCEVWLLALQPVSLPGVTVVCLVLWMRVSRGCLTLPSLPAL